MSMLRGLEEKSDVQSGNFDENCLYVSKWKLSRYAVHGFCKPNVCTSYKLFLVLLIPVETMKLYRSRETRKTPIELHWVT